MLHKLKTLSIPDSNQNLNPSDSEELCNKANNCWFLYCAHGTVLQGEDNVSGSCVCVCVCAHVHARMHVRDRETDRQLVE